jgi:hypothetical protein
LLQSKVKLNEHIELFFSLAVDYLRAILPFRQRTTGFPIKQTLGLSFKNNNIFNPTLFINGKLKFNPTFSSISRRLNWILGIDTNNRRSLAVSGHCPDAANTDTHATGINTGNH